MDHDSMVDEAGAGAANAARGEMELMLGGRAYVLRPSYEAIEAFEAGTGKGLLDLTQAALNGTLRLSEAAVIAAECMRAYGREAKVASLAASSAPRVAGMILESEGGYQRALVTLATVLAMACSGGVTATGEAKAATTTKTTTTMDGPPAAA